MKKNSNEKMRSEFYLVASICFYLSAVFCFLNEEANNAIAVINLCLGTSYLYLSSLSIKEEKSKNKEQ